MGNIDEKISSVQRWRHRIPLPNGTVTPGSQNMLAQLPLICLPEDLSGKTVLDIGCSDGFFSFECEKRGASRVLAVDDFSSVYIDSPAGFQVAHEILGSKVEYLEADLFSLNSEEIGQFDLVLFLGVLYHLKHPLLALERIANLCKGQLIVETLISKHPKGLLSRLYSLVTGFEPSRSWMEFYENDQINKDPTTWWAPTISCVESMLRAVGFCGVKTLSTVYRRGVFHAFPPGYGDDVDKLISRYGEHAVAQAWNDVLGKTIELEAIPLALRGLSVVQFGEIKQVLAESAAKKWHQVDRWAQKDGR